MVCVSITGILVICLNGKEHVGPEWLVHWGLRAFIVSLCQWRKYRAYIEKDGSMSEKRMLQNQNQNKLLK